MFGEDDIDFTPSTNTNLASLFNSTRSSLNSGNQSLTYKAPKQPKSKSKHENPTDSDSSVDLRKPKSNIMESKSIEKSRTATLDLLTVKTVQAFKMENGNYNSVGRLKAALCGSFINKHFEFIIYRDKTTHACRATVNKNFKFIVQTNNYVAFYNKANQLWSVLFESSEDAVEFSTQIALAKWCCLFDAGRGGELLVQNLAVGSNDLPKAEDGSIVDIYYIAKTITPDFKIGREVANNHNDGQPISVTVGAGWEKGLSGVSANSKRLMIIPFSLLGSWKPLVADECSLMLQVTVIKTVAGQSQSSGKVNLNIPTSRPNEGSDDNVSDKTVPRVCRPSSRNSKLAYPPLNSQNKVPHSNDSESESDEDTSVISKTGPMSKQKTKSFHSQSSRKRENCYSSLSSTQDEIVSPSHFHQLDPYSNFVHGPLNSSPVSADSHLSVYLSEMRIQNSEVRIGLGRVSDKVDKVLTKLEPKSVIDLNSLDDKIEKLMEINKEVKNKVFADFSTIESQYKEIISLLNKKVDEARAGDSVQKSAVLTEGVSETGPIEPRLFELETANSELKAVLAQSLRENNNLKTRIATLEQVNTQLQDDLREVSMKEVNNHEITGNMNLKEEIKQKMNIIYHSLKSQFLPDEQYAGQDIHAQLYNTIKCVTLEYLQEKRGDSLNPSSEKRNEVIESKAKSCESKPASPVPLDLAVLTEITAKKNDQSKNVSVDLQQSLSEGE